MSENFRREIPAVQSVWQALPKPLTVNEYWMRKAITHVIDQLRKDAENGQHPPNLPEIVQRVASMAEKISQPHLRPVINATGVMIHTNLGRSPLPLEIMEAVAEVATQYSTLEYDILAGERGSRHDHVAQILSELVGAEAAMVVNNNAAAVLIALSALAHGREVIVSRGELVEIGGSFRIPEVMALSGASLVEVGATNKTHPRDYEGAITAETALLLKVHQSNFRVIGFTESLSTVDLVQLGHARGISVMEDLGSGVIDPLTMDDMVEPSVKEVVKAGVDIVTFSGDKLLGGPQAGIIVGRKEIIDQLKKFPLARAVRVDKMTLAALERTIRWYLEGRAHELPLWQMMHATVEELRARAEGLVVQAAARISEGVTVAAAPCHSQIGGGSMPGTQMASYALTVTLPGNRGTAHFEERLRFADPAVIARIFHGSIIFDMRTIFPSQESLLIDTIVMALEQSR